MAERWEHSVGSRPHSVTVYERTPGGPIYVRIWDPAARGGEGRMVRRSLGHRDQKRAKVYAAEQHAKLVKGEADLRAGRVRLSRVLSLYQKHRTPRKESEQSRRADGRLAEMWTRVLGAGKDPHKILRREWLGFIDARRSGEIDARGNRVAKGSRRPVRARTVEADCDWLRWVFNWAVAEEVREDVTLMRFNPLNRNKFTDEIPAEKNPRRPVATRDRAEAIRGKTDDVPMEIRWAGKREERRSYLSEIFDIVCGTGRRISAVCSLRYRDLRLRDGTPHGSVRWPADTDKEGKETTVPIDATVRAALDRILEERPGIGDAFLFPSPVDPEKPVRYELASDWLEEAEELAEVEPHEGSLWHAYRRKWATERKHLPGKDVAAAGGWAGPETMEQAYQQADRETMLEVVLNPGELREAVG